MKRMLYGTSALGLTLVTLIFSASPVTAACSLGAEGQTHICDADSSWTSEGKSFEAPSPTASVGIGVTGELQDFRFTGSKQGDTATVYGESPDEQSPERKRGSLSDSRLEFEEGDDRLVIQGGSEMTNPGQVLDSNIDMGEGDDVIEVYGRITNSEANYVGTGQGNDEIKVRDGGLITSKIDTGSGDDTIDVEGHISNDSSESILTGEGADEIKVRGSGKITSNIDTGSGDDTIDVAGNISNDSSESILTGEGIDKIFVRKNTTLSSNVDMGAGNDVFQNEDSFIGRLDMGSGEDEAKVLSESVFTGTLDMGEGNDTLHAIDGSLENFSMIGGAGTDKIILDGESKDPTFNLSKVETFERVEKRGTGTWNFKHMSDGDDVSFRDGIEISDGAINFLDSFINTSVVVSGGELRGNLTLVRDAQSASDAAAALVNEGNGVIRANVTFSDYDDKFVNKGHIASEHNDGTDVVLKLGEGNDTFVNEGTISGEVDMGGGNDRFVLTGTDLFDLEPPGSILGGADGDDEGDHLELAGTGGTLMEVNGRSSAIRGFENLDVTSGTWNLSADQEFENDVTVDGGTLNVVNRLESESLFVNDGQVSVSGEYITRRVSLNSGALEILGDLFAPVVDVAEMGRLHGTGSITGDVNLSGEMTPGDFDNVGVLTVKGDVNMKAGSQFVVNVDPEAGTADRIDVSGFFAVSDGAKIKVVPLSPIPQGTNLKVSIANSSRFTGRFTIDETSQYTDYTVNYNDDGSVDLVMGDSFDPAVVDPDDPDSVVGNGPIYNHIANYIKKKDDDGESDTVSSTVKAALDALGQTGDARTDAYHSLTPEFYNAVYLSARAYANNVSSKVMARIDDREWCGTMRSPGEAHCRNVSGENGDIWASVEGLMTESKASEHSKYETKGISALFGIDRRIGFMTAGVLAGLGKGKTDINTLGSSDGFHASVGGYMSIPVEVANLDASVIYSYGSAENERRIKNASIIAGETGETVFTSESKIHQVTGEVRLTQEFKNQAGFEIQPSIGLALNYTSRPGITETVKSGDLKQIALVTEADEHFDTDLKAGIQGRYAVRMDNGVLIPEARINVSKKINGSKFSTKASYAETDGEVSDFEIEEELPDLVYSFGVGVNFEMDSGVTFVGDYDYRGGSSIEEHKGSVAIRYEF